MRCRADAMMRVPMVTRFCSSTSWVLVPSVVARDFTSRCRAFRLCSALVMPPMRL